MKALKFILIILAVLTIGFFATGLIVPETRYKTSIQIDKGIDEVFLAFTDIEASKDWVPQLKTVAVRNQLPEKKGSIYELEFSDDNSNAISVTQKIIEFEENRKVGISFRANKMDKINLFEFTLVDGKTRITLHGSCKSDSYILICIFPYFKGLFEEQDQLYLQSFKSYVENKS